MADDSIKTPAPEREDILVVDDNPDNLRYILSLLRPEGYRVRTAGNGADLFRLVRRNPPDLILMDVVMPDSDGCQVCRQLKADPGTAAVPVIFQIGVKGTPEDIARGFAAGGVDYIPKPFSAEELLARVRTHLELKCLRDNLAEQVAIRTDELARGNRNPERTNAAMEVLLSDLKEKHQSEADNIVHNVRDVLLPFLEKLELSGLKPAQKEWVFLLRNRLKEIISTFARSLSSHVFDLTPAEIQVAELIRNRKRTKEIAKMLSISESTVIFHRNNIRRKLNLVRKNVNLGVYLRRLDAPEDEKKSR